MEPVKSHHASDHQTVHSKPISKELKQEPSESSPSLDEFEDGLSLEELSQIYARMMGIEGTEPVQSAGNNSEATSNETDPPQSDSALLRIDPMGGQAGGESRDDSPGQCVAEDSGPASDTQSEDDSWPVTPEAIVEAVLMVGRPDGSAITATEIAALMRGVSEAEVDQIVEELNADYLANDRALHIASIGGGYRMQLAEDLTPIAEAFLGPARPVRLSQAAIDCLALVSYQPGITREQLNEQLGKSCGPILNQLVRRELLEMRRQKIEGKNTARYFPTNRLLKLIGLDSFDDLPTAEEWLDRQ